MFKVQMLTECLHSHACILWSCTGVLQLLTTHTHTPDRSLLPSFVHEYAPGLKHFCIHLAIPGPVHPYVHKLLLLSSSLAIRSSIHVIVPSHIYICQHSFILRTFLIYAASPTQSFRGMSYSKRSAIMPISGPSRGKKSLDRGDTPNSSAWHYWLG